MHSQEMSGPAPGSYSTDKYSDGHGHSVNVGLYVDSHGNEHLYVNGIPVPRGSNPYELAWHMMHSPVSNQDGKHGPGTAVQRTLSGLVAACIGTGSKGGCNPQYVKNLRTLSNNLWNKQGYGQKQRKWLLFAAIFAVSVIPDLVAPEGAIPAEAALETAVLDGDLAAADEQAAAAAEDEEAASSSVCANSFTPDTKVLMADGTTKPIKDIKVGDTVTATDPVTGKTKKEKVTRLHDHHDTDLTDLTITTPNGHTTTIHTTWLHPFWNDTTHH